MTKTVHWYAARRGSLAAGIEERLMDSFDYGAEDRLVADWRASVERLREAHAMEAFLRPHPYAHPKKVALTRDHHGR